MQNQFKSSSKLCRYGTLEECSNRKCRFQHTNPPPLYSTALKSASPKPATPAFATATKGSLTKPSRPITRDKGSDERSRFQDAVHSTPASPSSEVHDTAPTTHAQKSGSNMNVLAQATDGLTIYRAWLETQVEAQKAKVKAMSAQYSIPIPNLDSNPFDIPSLTTLAAAQMVNALPTTAVATGVASNLHRQTMATLVNSAQEVPLALGAYPALQGVLPNIPKMVTTHDAYCAIPLNQPRARNRSNRHKGPTQ
ncbi:hypothetical protein B0F90DRAFT_382345 [Multifurca ochricompacta]|uniref:C3H1-type domain-containing protein n=1 Tax=Multifurca ochricompacta TaxID=376703 RepID=A0AAD4LUR6_9AGAM|nr:hypothetical protein B0F90DRAFT_382345 [Multifurca ochricompacta]